MRKATIEIECRDEEHLKTIENILNSLEDVYVRDKFIHAELSDANEEVTEGEGK